jgi:hypothetical protein
MMSVSIGQGGKWKRGHEDEFGVHVSAGSAYYDGVVPEWFTAAEARELANEILKAADKADAKNATPSVLDDD